MAGEDIKVRSQGICVLRMLEKSDEEERVWAQNGPAAVGDHPRDAQEGTVGLNEDPQIRGVD